MPLPRNCKNPKCETRIENPTKYQMLCSNCQKRVRNVNFIKLLSHRKGISLKDLNEVW